MEKISSKGKFTIIFEADDGKVFQIGIPKGTFRLQSNVEERKLGGFHLSEEKSNSVIIDLPVAPPSSLDAIVKITYLRKKMKKEEIEAALGYKVEIISPEKYSSLLTKYKMPFGKLINSHYDLDRLTLTYLFEDAYETYTVERTYLVKNNADLCQTLSPDGMVFNFSVSTGLPCEKEVRTTWKKTMTLKAIEQILGNNIEIVDEKEEESKT